MSTSELADEWRALAKLRRASGDLVGAATADEIADEVDADHLNDESVELLDAFRQDRP